MADAKSFLGLYHIVWGYEGPTVKFVIVIAIVRHTRAAQSPVQVQTRTDAAHVCKHAYEHMHARVITNSNISTLRIPVCVYSSDRDRAKPRHEDQRN